MIHYAQGVEKIFPTGTGIEPAVSGLAIHSLNHFAGFMGERATTDQMFAIRLALQKCREYNVPTHHLFIDFKSAYDPIDREQLWWIMHENGFPDKLIRLIKEMMDRVMCVVHVSGTLLSPFESCRPYAECGTGDKQPWSEWNGDGYYVQQRPPRP